MLETMQEGTVTVGGQRHKLKKPFFVMATQNPIEQEGTYPAARSPARPLLLQAGRRLLEPRGAGDDRRPHDARRTIRAEQGDGRAEILQWQQLVREVILAPHVQDYVVRLALATHPEGPFALPITNQYLRWGASPRGAQTLALAAKVRALLEGRYNVSFEDIRRVYLPALRHRVILNFEAQAEGIDTDQVLLEILEKLSREIERLRNPVRVRPGT